MTGDRDGSDDHEKNGGRSDDRPSRFGKFREDIDGSTDSTRDDPSDRRHAADEPNDRRATDEPVSDPPASTEEPRGDDREDSWEWIGTDPAEGTGGPGATDPEPDGTPAESLESDAESDERERDDRSRSGNGSTGGRIWGGDDAADGEVNAGDGPVRSHADDDAGPDPDDDVGPAPRGSTAAERATGDHDGPDDPSSANRATETEREADVGRPDGEASNGDSRDVPETTDEGRERPSRGGPSTSTGSASDREGPSDRTPSADERSETPERRRRLWDRDGASGDGPVNGPPRTGDTEETPPEVPVRGSPTSTTGGERAAGPEEGYRRPDGLDLEPGTSVLVQCGSQDDRKHAACRDLIGREEAGDRDVLLIRYRRMDPRRLERIANAAHRTKLITVGYSQSVPDSAREEVEVASVHNPNDITRLGILVSGTVEDWRSDDTEIVLCYDSVNVLLEYKDVQNTFRFLHVFLGTLQESDVISHFHADPLSGDPQEINTLKPLFDAVITIDSVGVELE